MRQSSQYLIYEFKDGLNRYLATANAQVKTLADVISFNKNNEAKAMPYFKQETLESSEKSGELKNKEYTDALKLSLSSRKIIDDMMREHELVCHRRAPALVPPIVLIL